ncbi:MAG: hypothetical protein ACYC35_22535 [Pirellulales bacterium]
MRLNHSYMFAGAVLVLLPLGNLLAAEPDLALAAPALPEPATTAAPAPETAKATAPVGLTGVCNPCLDPVDDFIVRAGWWGLSTSGSPTKVGEYQGLDSSSPFWDFDGLFSNGNRTVDVTVTGPESEDTMAALRYYGGPGLSATLGYERFPHRLDHDLLFGFLSAPSYPASQDPPPTTPPWNLYTRDDRNIGQDYAIRVQEFKSNFKGNLADGLKWRLNVFGIEKEGERQAKEVTHCFTDTTQPSGSRQRNQCHVISQSQRINWRTIDFEPAIEAQLTDWLVMEYSRTIRSFDQNDQIVLGNYLGNSHAGGLPAPNPDGSFTAGYAFVPDSITEIDRLKAHAELDYDTDVYVLSYVGNTKNKFRESSRHFGGIDGRITNNSFDGLTMTGYVKEYAEHTQSPPFALNSVYDPTIYQEPNLDEVSTPINRDITTTGVNGRWYPFLEDCGTYRSRFAFIGGYEYSQLRRRGAGDEINTDPPTVFVQPNSNRNMFTVGGEERWSNSMTSYVRYKFIDTRYPLIGITPGVSSSLDNALNTSLPTHEDRIELGNTWSPTDDFSFNGTLFVENATNHGPYANFDSTSVPFLLTTWYAPNDKWSLSGGYSNFANSIEQDITLGGSNSFTSPWQYTGKSDVFNLASAYAWSDRLTLTQGFEYVRGLNVITDTPTPAGAISYDNPPAPYAPLGSYSRVSVETFRISAGADYLWRPGISTYVRYNWYDYGDLSAAFNSGQAHMFLGGVTAVF